MIKIEGIRNTFEDYKKQSFLKLPVSANYYTARAAVYLAVGNRSRITADFSIDHLNSRVPLGIVRQEIARVPAARATMAEIMSAPSGASGAPPGRRSDR